MMIDVEQLIRFVARNQEFAPAWGGQISTASISIMELQDFLLDQAQVPETLLENWWNSERDLVEQERAQRVSDR